jgi:hypothetical protein
MDKNQLNALAGRSVVFPKKHGNLNAPEIVLDPIVFAVGGAHGGKG